MATIATLAARASKGEPGRLWRLAGEVIDNVIPIILTSVIIFGLGWVLLNPAP